LTGGARFIGARFADRLLERGHHARAFGNLTQQVRDAAASA